MPDDVDLANVGGAADPNQDGERLISPKPVAHEVSARQHLEDDDVGSAMGVVATDGIEGI